MKTEVTTILTFICVVVVVAMNAIGNASAAEYCQLETFEASCPDGSVILMQSAKYGRMKLGRCLTRDYFVGCDADVLPQLDQRCSGRRHCHMTIPDHSLLRALSCPQDLVSYLEAEFSCVKGAWASTSQCAISRHIDLFAVGVGYLNSEVTQTTGVVGTDRCPWQVHVHPGQRIRLTLIDLGLFLTNTTSAAAAAAASRRNHHQGGEAAARDHIVLDGRCMLYATIREVQNGVDSEFVVCSSRTRETVVHTSRDNRISVVVHASTSHRRDSIWGQGKFFLKYEVIGCADPVLPSVDVYLIRRGEQVDVVCNETQQSWHLVCRNTQWIGDYGNCTDGAFLSSSVESDRAGSWQFTYGLWFAVSAGVALGMAVGLGLLLVLYLHRQSKQEDAETSVGVQKAEMSYGGSSGHYSPAEVVTNGYDISPQPTQHTCALYSCHDDGSTADHVHVRCLYDTSDLLTIQH